MRTSFHHQPEAQHPNFQLSTSWQADYPIFRGHSGHQPSELSARPPALAIGLPVALLGGLDLGPLPLFALALALLFVCAGGCDNQSLWTVEWWSERRPDQC
jgi:hypothetical protein